MTFFLVAIVVIVVLYALVNRFKSDVKFLISLITSLSNDVQNLGKEMASLKEKIEDLSARPPEAKTTYIPDQAKLSAPLAEPEIQQLEIKPVPPEPDESVAPAIEAIETQEQKTPRFIDEVLSLHDPVVSYSEPEYKKERLNAQNGPAESWLSRNPDLEKFIGENLINKIGIAVLVLGIAFFVKYAIDQNWINESGRVCIGMGCGALLVGIAHYMRNSYRSFSSVLAGGGIAVFYFTIAFAYHQYHLMTQTAAFVIMVVITAFAVVLSVLYDKLELAVIATIGGFLAPFLVSNGQGNYTALFTYLVILNIGLLSLSWFKRWPAINVIALFFTVIIYASWLVDISFEPVPVSYPTALLFASIFYVVFIFMNMLHQLKNKLQFKAFDFFILLLISSSYYAAGMILLHNWNNGAYQGLFTLSIAIVNLGLAWIVFKSGKADRNLLYLLIGLTATFVTLTIPIQLHGHAITMFWSAEFVLLYWLYMQSGIRTFRQSSALLCLLTLASLGMDWNKEVLLSGKGLVLLFSDIKGLATNIIVTVAFAVYAALLRKNKDNEYLPGISAKLALAAMLTVSVSVLYLTCMFSVNLHFSHLVLYDVPNVYHRAITAVFGIALVALMQKNVLRASAVFQFATLLACFIFYIASNGLIVALRNGILGGQYPSYHFIAHCAASVLMAVLFVTTIQGIRRDPGVFGGAIKGVILGVCFMAVAFLSIEVLHLYVLAGYRNNNTRELTIQYGKAGLSALWGLCSFALMWLGMKYKQKTLRIISLSLFSIVLLKLFIFDISGISEGGKIFAFILLGVLLLTVSFMYQKLKKIIIDDHKEIQE